MSAEFEEYLTVLKASYDYEPQSEDEIAIKENQLLFLLERTDEDWWKVKVKGSSQEEDTPVGLVPAAYVEQATHTSIVRALYEYEASSSGELSLKENEVLLVFDMEDEWLLVQSERDGGKAGFVPGNYVEAFDGEEAPETTTAPQIVVPPSPPQPTAPYVDPAERVAAASAKVKADDIKTWSVSEVDKKGKKKKGTLGIGNGAVFFASESDKTPVQKWQTGDISDINIEKSKHVHIEIGGSAPISLHFNAGSKDTADAIVVKLESSKELATPTNISSQRQELSANDSEMSSKAKKSGATVHFSQAEPVIIPARESSEDAEEEEDISEEQAANEVVDEPDHAGSDTATVLYDFDADGEDELSVREGESLLVLERDSSEWWKCRNSDGIEGVVPASYLDASAGVSGIVTRAVDSSGEPEDTAAAAKEAATKAEAERLEAERMEEALLEKERKKLESEKRAKAAAAAAQARQQQQESAAADPRPPKEQSKSPPGKPDSKSSKANGDSSSSSRKSSDNGRPPPERTRVWHDRSGQFRVEAAFLGFSNGKLRLHKVNGVIVEVPSEKMSSEDMRYVEKMTNKRSKSSASSSNRKADEDGVPLAERRKSLKLDKSEPSRSTTQKTAATKKGPTVDWFEFFLSAGCDIDDCTRYASSFERDKIDESILPDITDSTMRSLGLREGDIIRVTKAIKDRHPQDRKTNDGKQDQMLRDEEMAKNLQAEENSSKPGSKPATSPGPPNLFAGPGGVLKNSERRGRPQPSKSLPPSNVDLNAIVAASDQIQRTSSPQAISLSTPASSSPLQPPPRSSSTLIPTTSGFEDDAWTNRPSSTQPLAPTPPIASARAPSAPPVSNAASQANIQPQRAASMQPAQAQNSGSSLAQTTDADIFNQLARLQELRTRSPAVTSPPQPMSGSPAFSTPPPVGYQNGLGLGSTPAPMTQHIQAQQTGFSQQSPFGNTPRGPFAPVPANQSLLQPLIPTNTGFNSFVPTRASPAASLFQAPPPLPPMPPMPLMPSFIAPQVTGYPVPEGLTSRPATYFGPGKSYLDNAPPPPPFNQGSPGLGQSSFSNLMAPPAVPASPPARSNNIAPANIFAQMKSGTFASGNEGAYPQAADKYDALRPNPTGFGGYQVGYQGGYYQ